MKRHHAALTLVETLLTLSIFFFVALAMGWMLLLGKTSWQAALDRSSVRQNLDLAGRKIAEELRDSQAGSLSISSVPSAFSFVTAENDQGIFQTTGSGDPNWQTTVVYSVNPALRELRRRSQPATGPQPLTLPQLLILADGSGTLILTNVDQCSLSILPGNGATLQLRSATTCRNGGQVMLSYQASIFLRN